MVIDVNSASESDIKAGEASGGRVTSLHHNRLALRVALRPEKYLRKPALLYEMAQTGVFESCPPNASVVRKTTGSRRHIRTIVGFVKRSSNNRSS